MEILSLTKKSFLEIVEGRLEDYDPFDYEDICKEVGNFLKEKEMKINQLVGVTSNRVDVDVSIKKTTLCAPQRDDTACDEVWRVGRYLHTKFDTPVVAYSKGSLFCIECITPLNK